VLFRNNYDFLLLRFLEKLNAIKVLSELHDGPVGGHFGGDTIAHKILHAGYYWPTLFKDAHAYAKKCKFCQTLAGRERKPTFPLQPVVIEEPFEQWGLDIIGEITPTSSQLHKYILTTTDYFTRWIESIPLKIVDQDQVISFTEHFIITRFGVSHTLIFDNASYFSSINLTEFALEKGIKIKYYANYYPEGNGLQNLQTKSSQNH